MSNVQPVPPNDQFPTGLTAVVGRDRDVAADRALLRKGTRLLTPIGPGGIGKTRLAIEVATALRPEFTDGIWYVPLAPIADTDLVVPTIAQAHGLRDRGARAPWEVLLAHLQETIFCSFSTTSSSWPRRRQFWPNSWPTVHR